VRPWVQFETIRQTPDQGFDKSIIEILGILTFEVTPTDPSVVSPSGYGFAEKGEAFFSKI
jgi:hypothetical protein